jgi:hypothetical protein
MDLNRFARRVAIDDTTSPLNRILFFPFAAVGTSRFSEGHGFLDLLFINEQSSGHPFDDGAYKRSMA